MKTNQLMTVCFPLGDLHIWHKTGMGSLTDLFRIGNSMRIMESKGALNITQFIEAKATQEFISVVMNEQQISYESVIKKAGRGKSARTEANLHFLIYAAQHLSVKFHYQVIDTFIKGKLLEWRDQSGDEYKALNMAIDAYLPDRIGKDNKSLYIQSAMLVKAAINPEGGDWNTAQPDELKQRTKLEEKLISFLKAGLVRDFDHLKSLIKISN